MQSIFRVAPTGIGLVSNRILLEVNTKICEMTGYSTYELVGKSSRIFYPSQREFDLVGDEKYAQIAKYGTGIVETQWQRKDGKIIDILLSSTPADPDDLSRGLIFTALDITERKRAEIMIYESEKAFAEINQCLVSLGSDYQDNINTLTALCGKLLGATCALYNRLEGEMLCSLGQWGTPTDFNPVDKPDGHICYDVICQGKREVFVVRNLPETKYFESDPNVKQYELVTYAGHAVISGDEPLGSLCVVYQHDTEISARDTSILSIIASALASEEQRQRSRSMIEESNRKYKQLSTLMRLLADNIPDMLWAKNLNREFIFANKALCDNLLNASDTEEPLGKTDMFFASRERDSNPENPQWHTFGEVCVDSDSITLQEMKPMRFEEFGNVKGKFIFLDVHKAPLYDNDGQLIGVVGSGRDVTSAKEAENQLRKLSQAVEQSPASVVITNPEGTIEYVNPKFTEVTGYTLEEAIGKNPRILKSGDQTQEYYKVMWETISKGKLWKGEFHNKKKNGELYWESALISPIMDEKGEILNYLAVKEDITEKVLVNNALRENEMKLRVVANYNYDWEYWIDPNGEFKYCSPSSYRITGHHADEFLANRSLLLECIHPNDRELFSVHQHTISGSDNIQELTFRIIRPDGSVRCLGHVCQEIYNEKGEFLGRRGSNRDITQRRLAEENLRLSEEKYRLLADNSADVIWMTDSEGYYTYVSPSVEKLYGYKPEEAIGLSMMMAVPPEQREDSAKGFQETVSYIQATGRGIPPYILELEQLCKDGSRFWVETLFKALFDEKDRFMGFLGITRDISERKKAMFQAQKHTDEQLLLASIANSLVGMESQDQMFDFIAQQVYNLCSDTYLVLSHLDKESEAFMLMSAYGFSDHFDNLQKYFGINPFKMALSLKDYPQDLLELLRNKKMNQFEIDGIHKVSAGVLSRKIGKLIENFLGIKRAYIMGISWNDQVYGAFVLLSKSDLPIENMTLMETIINQSALAVQRLYTSEELKRSESRYRSLVEMSPDGIGLFQLKGQLVSCNLEMARIFGYEDENDLLSQNFNAFNLIHPADQAKINKGLRLLMKGKPVPLEYYKLLRKDGSTFPGEVHSVIVQDEMGNSNLLLSIIRDVTERVKAEEALARYNEQLRNFAGHNEMVREKERMNLARDIHDILGSSLAGLKMELAVLKRQLSEDTPGSKPDIPRQISAMSLQINDSVELMRKIVRELRPGILDELGLAEAFKWYAGELESRSNISFMLQTSRAEIKLDKNLSVVIFRIFQEIMTNIVLHSKASRVHIRVEMHHNLFKLTVNDNGIGIKPEAVDKTDSFGLLGMRERAMLLNGKLSIFGEPAKGTTVILEVPIDNI